MSKELFIVLLTGAVLTCLTIAWQLIRAGQPVWKVPILSVAVVVAGYFGARFWFYLENGEFGGRSLYGAVFLTPIALFPLAKLLRIPYADAMDTVAPAGCLTSALAKVLCLHSGCCIGKILYLDENNMHVRFPSQLVEMVAFCVIVLILLAISANRKNRGTVYCWAMILYGASRFVLDFFREIETPWLFGLSAGSFWSACAFLIGVVSLLAVLYLRKKAARTKENMYEET